MKQVDRNRTKGNFAEHVAASWLSRACLIRPVAEGTDIGIDLYCESIVEETPFLHFWTQVKAITSDNISDDEETAWYDFEIEHLQYWKKQPIPVYAFLVPVTTWPPTFPTRIYGVAISRFIVGHGIPDQQTVRIKSSGFFDLQNLDADLRQFITEVVPRDASILLIPKGIIAPIPDDREGLQTHFPAAIGFQYLHEILNSIRDTAAVSILNALMAERVSEEYKPVRKRFEEILLLYSDNLHELALSALVRAAHQDGDLDRARAYVEDALAHLEQQPQSASTQQRIESIQALLEELG